MRLLIYIALFIPSVAMADLSLGAFYDPLRGLTIAEANWYSRLGSSWSAYGFVEAYRTPEQGFPPEKNVFFGKTWLMYDLTKKVSVGMEIEHGYNNAGMYSRSRPFQPDEFRVIPKFGASIKLQ